MSAIGIFGNKTQQYSMNPLANFAAYDPPVIIIFFKYSLVLYLYNNENRANEKLTRN